MPTTRKRGVTLAAATLGILLSGALSGCSISKDEEPDKQGASTSEPDPTPTPSEEPTPTPSPSASTTATPSAPPSGTPAATPTAALLSAVELPQLNDTSAWTEKRTGVPGPRSFGLCQQFDTLSIGATDVVDRAFTAGPTGKDTAGQQVAEFPDAQNTVRASKVLESWRQECRGQVRGKGVKVGALTSVPVAAGKGWSYLVSYTRGGTGHFHSFGMAYHGNRMTMLTMDHDGQDHNYEPGQDPMELAVKAASAKMG